MAQPQPGLFALGLAQHFHVELRVKDGVSRDSLCAALAEARREAGAFNGPNVVWGFAPSVWGAMHPSNLPADVTAFEGIRGESGIVAPATQYDIWMWCGAYAQQPAQEAAANAINALSAVADPALELACYTAPDSRDPTGFIDGTENPLIDEALEVAVYPEGSTGEGGCAVLVQRWVHQVAAFKALSRHDQELVIGRSREASIELPDAEMPETSHVSRNKVLDEHGNERHIYRRNTPFDNGAEAGTQFIGISNDPSVVLEMLRRMFNATGDGLHDRLTEFSEPVTGSQYFCPSMDALTHVFGPIGGEDEAVAEDDSVGVSVTTAPPTTVGSLGIGSLRDEALSGPARETLPLTHGSENRWG